MVIRLNSLHITEVEEKFFKCMQFKFLPLNTWDLPFTFDFPDFFLHGVRMYWKSCSGIWG